MNNETVEEQKNNATYWLWRDPEFGENELRDFQAVHPAHSHSPSKIGQHFSCPSVPPVRDFWLTIQYFASRCGEFLTSLEMVYVAARLIVPRLMIQPAY